MDSQKSLIVIEKKIEVISNNERTNSNSKPAKDFKVSRYQIRTSSQGKKT